MSNDKLVDVKDLQVHFPIFGGVFSHQVATVKAVDGVSFNIGKKQSIGMVGESGCGKTTVGRAMVSILKHVAPDVKVNGSIKYHFGDEEVDFVTQDARRMQKYRSKVQMIFQDPYASLNPRMTVAQIISEPLLIHTQMSKSEMQDRVAWLLDKVGLNPEQARRFPHEFSGGQRQRIGIARAVATNPELIICDEPVSALDVSIQAQVINLMMDLQDEFDLSYLFIAHDLSVVEHISDKIVVMYLGNVVEFGNANDVYHNPKHPYSRALLSAVPLPNPKLRNKKRVVLQGDIPSPMAKPSGCGFRNRCPIAKPECAEKIPELVDTGGEQMVACPHWKEEF